MRTDRIGPEGGGRRSLSSKAFLVLSLGLAIVLVADGPASARPRRLWYKIKIQHRERTSYVRVIPNVPNRPGPDADVSTRTWRTDSDLSWEIRSIEPTLVVHAGHRDLIVLSPTQAVAEITDYSVRVQEDSPWREPPCPHTWTSVLTSGGPLLGLIGSTRSTAEWGLDFVVTGRGSTLASYPDRTCTFYANRPYPVEVHTPNSTAPGSVEIAWQAIPYFTSDNRFGGRRMIARRTLQSSWQNDSPTFAGETESRTTRSRTKFIFTRCPDQRRPDLC